MFPSRPTGRIVFSAWADLTNWSTAAKRKIAPAIRIVSGKRQISQTGDHQKTPWMPCEFIKRVGPDQRFIYRRRPSSMETMPSFASAIRVPRRELGEVPVRLQNLLDTLGPLRAWY